MTAGKLPDPILITRPADLRFLSDTLQGQPIIAVDTESNSLFAYREKVCLIQFSTPETDFLVDPITLKELSPLGPVFSSPAIEKVFHAAEYDLLGLRRDLGFEFVHLFDTMLAARILGRKEFGLGSILEAEFGVSLDKRHQRANWGQRPLPVHLLDYARLDTHYLIPLRQRLKMELQRRNLLPLAEEDFQRLNAPKVNGNHQPVEGQTTDCWRVSGSHDLHPHQAAILQELCRYRERIAQASDRPLFKVINDQTLLAIAVHAPQSRQELASLPGMSPGQIQRHGNQLLQAVQRGLQAEPIFPPRSPRPDEKFIERLEALRRWRKAAAQQMDVPSDVVLPRDLLLALAGNNPCRRQELEEVMNAAPWRLEHFGSQILEVLNRLNRR